jgi:hypothetical protein
MVVEPNKIMKFRYLYKSKKTNERIESDVKLKNPDYILISVYADTQIKSKDKNIIKK